jgi:hypothetical protein
MKINPVYFFEEKKFSFKIRYIIWWHVFKQDPSPEDQSWIFHYINQTSLPRDQISKPSFFSTARRSSKSSTERN